MSDAALYLADGTGFLVGALAVAAMLAWAAMASPRNRFIGRARSMIATAAALLMVVSPMPWSWLWLGFCLAIVAAATAAMDVQPKARKAIAARRTALIAGLTVALVLLAAGLRHRVLPEIVIGSQDVVYVIGDSISAGLEGEPTWPEMLADRSALDVVNLARAGAMVSETDSQAGRIPGPPGVVLVEIGGNDVLCFTDRPGFSESIRGLLEGLTEQGLRVVMFEIPLPPFGNGYGLAQRKWAAKYGVQIIPRHVLAGVLRMHGATSDGLHLSEQGHRGLADAMAERLTKSALD